MCLCKPVNNPTKPSAPFCCVVLIFRAEKDCSEIFSEGRELLCATATAELFLACKTTEGLPKIQVMTADSQRLLNVPAILVQEKKYFSRISIRFSFNPFEGRQEGCWKEG